MGRRDAWVAGRWSQKPRPGDLFRPWGDSKVGPYERGFDADDFSDGRELSRVPQRPHHRVRRGRVDRIGLARIDHGEFVARSVLAGVRAPGNDRSPGSRCRDRRCLRRLSHADGARAGRRQRPQRAGVRASAGGRQSSLPRIDSRTTACRARCAIRSPTRSSARQESCTGGFIVDRGAARRPPHHDFRSFQTRQRAHDDRAVGIRA